MIERKSVSKARRIRAVKDAEIPYTVANADNPSQQWTIRSQADERMFIEHGNSMVSWILVRA